MILWSSCCNMLKQGCCYSCVDVLTVGIKEGEDFTLSYAGPQQPGCDEALSLRLSDHTDNLQLLHKLLQLVLKMLWGYKTSLWAGDMTSVWSHVQQTSNNRHNDLWNLVWGVPLATWRKRQTVNVRDTTARGKQWSGKTESRLPTQNVCDHNAHLSHKFQAEWINQLHVNRKLQLWELKREVGEETCIQLGLNNNKPNKHRIFLLINHTYY